MPPGLCEPWPAILRDCVIPTSSLPFTGTGLEMASEVLWALTARQFGLCERTVRPCRETCDDALLGYAIPTVGANGLSGINGLTYPTPLLYAGNWYNITCGSCTGGCSCATLSEVALPGPVHEVLEVLVDGVALVKNVDYRLDNSRLLVRINDLWPLCNNLNLANTEVGTWSVRYNFGTEVPTLGQAAVGVLAIEFAKALACDDSCALPKPVQSITRQGVSVTFLDPNEVFTHGRTGLYLPDLFIQTYNPSALRSRARVYDIDRPDFGRRLGTG